MLKNHISHTTCGHINAIEGGLPLQEVASNSSIDEVIIPKKLLSFGA